jgi:hypothetical protein
MKTIITMLTVLLFAFSSFAMEMPKVEKTPEIKGR